MLQIIAGLDAETLEAVAVAAPVQLQLLQRRLDGAGIQQSTAQDLLLRLAARLAQHLHQGAAIAALCQAVRHSALPGVQWLDNAPMSAEAS